jgi:hypothetical protein
LSCPWMPTSTAKCMTWQCNRSFDNATNFSRSTKISRFFTHTPCTTKINSIDWKLSHSCQQHVQIQPVSFEFHMKITWEKVVLRQSGAKIKFVIFATYEWETEVPSKFCELTCLHPIFAHSVIGVSVCDTWKVKTASKSRAVSSDSAKSDEGLAASSVCLTRYSSRMEVTDALKFGVNEVSTVVYEGKWLLRAQLTRFLRSAVRCRTIQNCCLSGTAFCINSQIKQWSLLYSAQNVFNLCYCVRTSELVVCSQRSEHDLSRNTINSISHGCSPAAQISSSIFSKTCGAWHTGLVLPDLYGAPA